MNEKSEFTRLTLLSQKMGFNQMRNSLYWLQRYMKNAHLDHEEIEQRFLKIGKNIGASFSKVLLLSSDDITNAIQEIYFSAVKSKVKVVKEGDLFSVFDAKCALCKYQYEDIDLAACTIVIGLVTEIFTRFGYKVENPAIIESKTYGDSQCVHQYIIQKVELLHE